jgi:hypothetical protein
MHTEARTVLRIVVMDFFLNCWCLEIPSDTRIRHVPGCVDNPAQIFRLKDSSISMFEMETYSTVLFGRS